MDISTVFSEELGRDFAAAAAAGNSLYLSTVVSASGYDAAILERLLQELLNAVKTFRVDERALKVNKVLIAQAYENEIFANPLSIGFSEINTLLSVPAWSAQEVKNELSTVTSVELQTFINQRMFNMVSEMEAFVFGRYDCNKSSVFVDLIRSSLGLHLPLSQHQQKQQTTGKQRNFHVKHLTVLSPDEEKLLFSSYENRAVFSNARRRRIVKLPRKSFAKDIETSHNSHAVVACYQPTTADYRSATILMLLTQMFSNDFYDDLRTNQQLGYDLSMSTTALDAKALLLCFGIESAKNDSSQLFASINQFVIKMRRYLADIGQNDETRLRSSVEALRNSWKQKATNRAALKAHFWAEIASGEYQFDRTNRYLQELENISAGELLTFINDLTDPKQQRLLVLKTAASVTPATTGIFANFTKLLDYQSLKTEAEFFPV